MPPKGCTVVRRVRTSEGSRYYGLPIGSPITAADIARARVSNKGKPAPKGASGQAGAVRSSRVKAAAQKTAAEKAARAARKVSPTVKVVPPKKPKGSGAKVKAGSTEFAVDKNSRSFTRPGSDVVYNVGEGGDLRVLAPSGEAQLTPEQESRVKALMVAESESFEEVKVAAEPEKPRSRFSPTNPDGTPKEDSRPDPAAVQRAQDEVAERKRKDDERQAAKNTGVFGEYNPAARAASGSDTETTPLTDLGYERDEDVTVYRGVPADATGGIRPGDWVTTDERLAKDYAGTGKVLSLTVKAQHLRTDPDDDSMAEMVFSPERIPDSIGESVVVDPGDLLDMQKSPLTSKHLTPEGDFTPERKALHDQIIARFFEGVAPSAAPVQFMNGGGPASGKGTMTRGDNAKITGYPATNLVDDEGNFVPALNPGGVIVDPDQLKLSLPEGQKAVKDFADGVERAEEYQEWAANLHGESSYLGQRLAQAALDRGVNLILDGVNDGSVESVTKKVMKARNLGYEVQANYIYLEPGEALPRALQRAERAGRRVPKKIILGAYSKLPGIFDGIKNGLFDKVRLFDNNVDGTPAYMLGEGSIDSEFSFVQPEYAEVYQRYLESAQRATDMLGFDQVLSGADEAQIDNMRDLMQPPPS